MPTTTNMCTYIQNVAEEDLKYFAKNEINWGLPSESMIKNWVKIPTDARSKCALIDRIKLNSDILPSWHLISTGYYLLDIWMIHINNKTHQTLLQLLSVLSISAKCHGCCCYFFTQPLNKLFWNTHEYAIRWHYIYWAGKNCKKWHHQAHIGLYS